MITPTLINTVGAKVLWTITVENKEVPNTGVYTNLTIPPVFSITDTILITNGTLTAGVWSIGNLAPSEVAKLILEIEYVGPTAGFDVNFDFVAQVFGLDTVSTNNTLTDTVNYKSLACGPLGGGVEDFSGCLCIDVSENDTKCTEGTSQWVLNTASVANSVTYRWDDTTGKGSFTPVDPSKPITGTCTLNCINGASTVQVSCDVPFTIYPQLESKNIFDHKASNKKGTDLTAAEIATIKTQPEYSLLTDAEIQAYCWNTLLNGEGTLVGGWALDCNEKQDARTFFECSTEDCVNEPNPCPTCPQGSLPTDVATIVNAYVDYEEEIGDTIYVKHPNAYSVYKWNGSQWIKWSCGCIFTISQDADNLLTLGTDSAPYLDPASLPAAIKVTAVDVTGTTTKTITITNSDGSTATDTFTDLDTDTTYILDGTTTPGTIFLRNAVTNDIVSTVVLPIGGGQTYVQVSDTCSLDLTISGDGSMANPYIISGEVLTGNPVPLYVSGTVAPGSSHTVPDVGVLFTEACGAGCTATYTVIGYPDAVFENVVLTGIVLTYDIKADAPGGGTHFIEIEKTCA